MNTRKEEGGEVRRNRKTNKTERKERKIGNGKLKKK